LTPTLLDKASACRICSFDAAFTKFTVRSGQLGGIAFDKRPLHRGRGQICRATPQFGISDAGTPGKRQKILQPKRTLSLQIDPNGDTQMGVARAVAAIPEKPLTQTKAVSKSRISSIDVMRGLVIVLMLVDHVREKLYLHVQVSDPMDVANTSPDLFFTRMSAHLCAPAFVFLTGMSAWLYSHPASGQPRSATGFLFKRGLFLVVLELTLINFSWFGTYTTLYLQVIWAIGLSMIALSLLVRLPFWLIATTGAVIVVGHNLLTPITFQPGETGYTLWTILHDRGYLIADGPLKVKVSYPVLPWIGVILLGYTAARSMLGPSDLHPGSRCCSVWVAPAWVCCWCCAASTFMARRCRGPSATVLCKP
jgi:uncharacterized membrane protein